MRQFIFLSLIIIVSCQNSTKQTIKTMSEKSDIVSRNILIEQLKELSPRLLLHRKNDSMAKINCYYAIGFHIKRLDKYNLGRDTLVSFSFYSNNFDDKLDQKEEYYKGCFLMDSCQVLIFDKYNVGEAYYNKLHLLKKPLKNFKYNKQRSGLIFFFVLKKRNLKKIILNEIIQKNNKFKTYN